MTLFEKKFGLDFLKSVPQCPAVYTFWAAGGLVVYIGKAKNLRKRLAQYRKPRQRRTRSIVKDSVRVTWEIFGSDLEACLAELKQIREIQPKRNVAGAYTFLYPLIGLRAQGTSLNLCYTTSPQGFPGFDLYGAFRSREIAGEAFFALARLFEFVGHRSRVTKAEREKIPAYSYRFEFRRMPEGWAAIWSDFFRGASVGALEILALKLLENAGARAKACEVQDDLKTLKRFWRHEASPLARVITFTQYSSYPVAQGERDSLFLRADYLKKEKETST